MKLDEKIGQLESLLEEFNRIPWSTVEYFGGSVLRKVDFLEYLAEKLTGKDIENLRDILNRD